MNFLIAATFTDALARLPAPEQKAAKTSAYRFADEPDSIWACRCTGSTSRAMRISGRRASTRDLRLIVH